MEVKGGIKMTTDPTIYSTRLSRAFTDCKQMLTVAATGLLLLFFCLSAKAQLVITKSTVAGGGQSSGGPFSVGNTVGESSCGSATGGTFSVTNGYYGGGTCPPASAAPTAAGVTISGQAVTRDGRGIRNVVVTLTDGAGHVRTGRTNAFGYFEFDVPSGASYVVQATGRRYSFAPAIVQAKDNLTGLTLTAQ